MMTTVSKLNWDELRRNVFEWWNTRSNDQFTKVNGMRERSISILQKRYGYTKEAAAYQLDNHYPKAWLG
jgi:hypothetical protein